MSFLAIGSAIVNPIAAALIASVGWRTAYVAVALIAAVVVLPCTMLLIRFKPEDKGILPYGIDAASESGAEEAAAIMNEGVSAKRAYRSASFWILVLIFAAFAFLNSISNLLPLYMESIGMIAIVGLISTMTMAGQFISTLGLGGLADRFGGTAAGVTGLAIAGCGFLLLIFFGQMVAGALGGGALYGVFGGLSSIAPPLLVRAAFGNKDFAKLYSNFMLVVNGMGFFALPIMSLTVDMTGEFNLALWLAFGICVACIPMIMASMRLAKKLPREA